MEGVTCLVQHVKGHTGDIGNEIADDLARKALKDQELAIFCDECQANVSESNSENAGVLIEQHCAKIHRNFGVDLEIEESNQQYPVSFPECDIEKGKISCSMCLRSFKESRDLEQHVMTPLIIA